MRGVSKDGDMAHGSRRAQGCALLTMRNQSAQTLFPQLISGLRKPIAIQAAISFSMNLPE